MSQKGSLFSRLFGRAGDSSKVASGSVSSGSASNGLADQSDLKVEVWLRPDTEELKKQTLMQARKIDQPVFLIGRRSSETIAYPHENPPDLLIFENSPYTLSKLQCQIEISEDQVILRDLGSRTGTILGNKRLLSRKRKPISMVVPRGSHSLILGSREGPYRFRLEVC